MQPQVKKATAVCGQNSRRMGDKQNNYYYIFLRAKEKNNYEALEEGMCQTVIHYCENTELTSNSRAQSHTNINSTPSN